MRKKSLSKKSHLDLNDLSFAEELVDYIDSPYSSLSFALVHRGRRQILDIRSDFHTCREELSEEVHYNHICGLKSKALEDTPIELIIASGTQPKVFQAALERFLNPLEREMGVGLTQATEIKIGPKELLMRLYGSDYDRKPVNKALLISGSPAWVKSSALFYLWTLLIRASTDIARMRSKDPLTKLETYAKGKTGDPNDRSLVRSSLSEIRLLVKHHDKIFSNDFRKNWDCGDGWGRPPGLEQFSETSSTLVSLIEHYEQKIKRLSRGVPKKKAVSA